MGHRVAIVAQKDYGSPGLEAALRRVIGLAGFDLAGARGKRVLLKPNMLGAYPPAMGVTSPPPLVAALVRLFQEAGATVAVGDSPNGFHPLEQVWETTGIGEVCRAAGAQGIRFESSGSVEVRGVRIAKAVVEADLVVNLPKLKTHGLTFLTLGVKNLFGCVPGMRKSRIHRQAIERRRFAEALVAIAEAVRPALTIVDAVTAMEGDGPSAGKLVPLGALVAGVDVHAVDAACCRIVGLPSLELDTLAVAKERGLFDDGTPIDLVGDPVEAVAPASFAMPSTYTRKSLDSPFTRFVLRRIWEQSWVLPAIHPGRCRRCGLCVGGCPVGAIVQTDERAAPVVVKKKCIQCFCCHELCPHRAIDLRRSLAVRFVSWLTQRRARHHLPGR